MKNYKKFENVIMAFASLLGHAWVAREMVGYFEKEKQSDEADKKYTLPKMSHPEF